MEQKTALNILKLGKNVFITGAAGTGKTHLLGDFIEYLEIRDIKPTIVAPTGIAASHLGGQTIHSFFGLGIREIVDEVFIDKLLAKKFLKNRFNKLKVLIIDEISMVSPELFSSIDMILKAFKFPMLPFGGVQVILSGDFFQLPPISKEFRDKRFAWQSPIWKELDFRTCYLQKKFRQDDNKLITILDDIRSGVITESTHNLLASVYNRDLDIGFKPTRLYTHNVDVDRINSRELDTLDETEKIFEYTSKGVKQHIEKIFKSSLVLEKLALKKGAVVIFIKNNLDKNYINGTTGVVTGFTKEDSLPIVKVTSGIKIIADFEDWSIDNDDGTVLAKVTQIPLRLAWAITIHKSQGMSLDSAEIDLSRTFEVGQGYVALSRIKNIEGLKLIGLNEMALKVDPLILKIDDRIKMASDRAKNEVEEIPEHMMNHKFFKYIKELGGDERVKSKSEIKTDMDQRIDLFVANLEKSSTKISTYDKTENLIEESSSIEELAKNRNLTKGTIVKHLVTLKKRGKNLNIDKFKPTSQDFRDIEKTVEDIKFKNDKDDFTDDKRVKSNAIFQTLNGKIGFDKIKEAMLFIK